MQATKNRFENLNLLDKRTVLPSHSNDQNAQGNSNETGY